jgi:hypothetical protein
MINFRQAVCSGLQVDRPGRGTLLYVKLIQYGSILSFQSQPVLTGQRAVFNCDRKPAGCVLHLVRCEAAARELDTQLITTTLLGLGVRVRDPQKSYAKQNKGWKCECGDLVLQTPCRRGSEGWEFS